MKTGFIFLMLACFVSVSSNAQMNSTQVSNGYQGLYSGAISSFGNSVPSVPTFSSKAQTIGNQYLFENWVTGTIVDNDGTVFSEGYLFNFNKINQNVYFRLKDSAVAFLINKSLLKSVTLTDGMKTYTLEKVPSLDSNYLYTVLVKGKKYSLYSLTKTNFVAANYFTNGITSSGSMYDEFKDEVKYYVVKADGTKKEVPLKRKAIKTAFESDKEKVAEFFKANDNAGTFGEDFLKSLVESLSL
jgi:hypothetical protein